jgi:hypothetical protein
MRSEHIFFTFADLLGVRVHDHAQLQPVFRLVSLVEDEGSCFQLLHAGMHLSDEREVRAWTAI